MPRRPDLSAVTAAVQEAGQSRQAKPSATGTRRRRENTVPLTVHVAPDVRTQVKILAAEQDTTVHALVCEGLNLVFAKHRRPEIAQ